MNITEENKEIAIDLNLTLAIDISEQYQKRMMIVYDVAERLPDYCSVVVMDHGIVLKTIESKRKRKEDILEATEFIKKQFEKYFESNEN